MMPGMPGAAGGGGSSWRSTGELKLPRTGG